MPAPKSKSGKRKLSISPKEKQILAKDEADAFARPAYGAIQPIRGEAENQVFRFEVGPAILEQVRKTLERMPIRTLTESIKHAKHPGFYQLFLDGKPVYIGKTSRQIRARLAEHVKKISSRIDIMRMTCRYAYVEDPSLVDVAEGALINFFEKEASWNTSGFGSKVTGAGRSGQARSAWDEQFQADVNKNISITCTGEASLRKFIQLVAQQAPFTLSVPTTHLPQFKQDHPHGPGAISETRSFEEWCLFIAKKLAKGWRIDRRENAYYIRPEGSS
jgi:hypothetical protein